MENSSLLRGSRHCSQRSGCGAGHPHATRPDDANPGGVPGRLCALPGSQGDLQAAAECPDCIFGRRAGRLYGGNLRNRRGRPERVSFDVRPSQGDLYLHGMALSAWPSTRRGWQPTGVKGRGWKPPSCPACCFSSPLLSWELRWRSALPPGFLRRSSVSLSSLFLFLMGIRLLLVLDCTCRQGLPVDFMQAILLFLLRCPQPQ